MVFDNTEDLVTPRIPVQGVTRQQYEMVILGFHTNIMKLSNLLFLFQLSKLS